MQFVKPLPFSEAVGKIGAKSAIGSQMLSSEWSDVPVALRERAFFSSQVESVRFLQRTRDWIGDFVAANRETLPSGETALAVGSRAQFVELARQFALEQGLGPLTPEDAGTIKDITSERRLGLIFDTQTRQAGDYGYWRQGMDQDVLNEFPAQRFVRVQEVKQERDSHKQFENQVYLKTDPIWAQVINEDFGVPWGPWAWGCGHDVEDVDRAEAEQLGLLKPGEEVQPDVKSFNENLEASTKGLDPDLVDKLKEEFGEQLQIEGETMSWRETEAGTPEPVAPAVIVPPEVQIPEPEPETPAGMPALPGEPAAEPPAKDEVKTAPVSDAIMIKAKGVVREVMKTGLAAIDDVHDDGTLPEIPAVSSRRSSFGVFTSRAGKAVQIEVRPTGNWPTLTFVHETGHFLDLEGIGVKGSFATLAGNKDMADVLKAADQTQAIKALRKKLEDNPDSMEVEYLLKKQEIWARAYAQFVAEESENKSLTGDLAKLMADPIFRQRQWTEEDFAPLSAAIKELFNKLGWL